MPREKPPTLRCPASARPTVARTWLARARGIPAAMAMIRVDRPAILLYQSIGFEAVGLRRGYYQAVGGREDALVYRLNLRTWQEPTRGR